MKIRLEDHVSMFQKVAGLLELHKDEMVELPIVLSYKDTLQEMIVEMLFIASKSGTDITGYAVDKGVKRKEMIVKTRSVATALLALGVMEDDQNRQELYGATEAEMAAMRDNDLFAYAKTILDGALPILDKLLIFGVDAPLFEEATLAVEAFFDAITEPEEQLQKRARYNKELDEKAVAIGNFLTDKLDKVMELYSVRNPGLYKAYKLCRKIEDTAPKNKANYRGTVLPGSTVVVDQNIVKGHVIEVENLGEVLLECCMSSDAQKMEGNVQRIRRKTGLSINKNEFNPDAAAVFLLVKNSGTTMGEYRIWIS